MSSNEKDNVVAKHTAGVVAVIHENLKPDIRFLKLKNISVD